MWCFFFFLTFIRHSLDTSSRIFLIKEKSIILNLFLFIQTIIYCIYNIVLTCWWCDAENVTWKRKFLGRNLISLYARARICSCFNIKVRGAREQTFHQHSKYYNLFIFLLFTTKIKNKTRKLIFFLYVYTHREFYLGCAQNTSRILRRCNGDFTGCASVYRGRWQKGFVRVECCSRAGCFRSALLESTLNIIDCKWQLKFSLQN